MILVFDEPVKPVTRDREGAYDGLPLDLLRRHVGDRTEGCAGAGEMLLGDFHCRSALGKHLRLERELRKTESRILAWPRS
jgi:hypothetical protein